MFKKKSNSKEFFSSESTYCGHCADNLPDETLSYCPTCGVLFAEVPPTASYHLLLEGQWFRERRRQLILTSVSYAFFALFSVLLLYLYQSSALKRQLQSVQPQRKVIFYTHENPNFKALSSEEIRAAIYLSFQAFEDHFSWELKHWEVREAMLPEPLDKVWSMPWREEMAQVKYWQRWIAQFFLEDWNENPYAPLPVIITNLPIQAPPLDESLETRHLSSSRLIGGLGHQAAVFVSSYRLLHEIKEESTEKRIRYMGEYLLAHEWGHALLGIQDFILSEDFQKSPSRSLASEYGLQANDHPELSCIMHTDAGGGHAAWSRLSKRPLGQKSSCVSYEALMQAHELKLEALRLLRQGQRIQAQRLYEDAYMVMETQAVLPWMRHLWQREKKLFMPPFKAWLHDVFVFNR